MLFHLHIPKTGGTTLFSALAGAVAPGRWHLAVSKEEIAARTTGYALLGGHFDWDTLALFPERPRVLTVLRDPIDRALSTYGYARTLAGAGVFDAQTQTFADEAASRPIEDLILDPGSIFRSLLGMTTFFLARQEARASGRATEDALRNLENCAWVGTTATLDRDMQILPALFGLAPFGTPRRELVTPRRPHSEDLSKAARQALEALTASDRLLYDRACAIADEQQRYA